MLRSGNWHNVIGTRRAAESDCPTNQCQSPIVIIAHAIVDPGHSRLAAGDVVEDRLYHMRGHTYVRHAGRRGAAEVVPLPVA